MKEFLTDYLQHIRLFSRNAKLFLLGGIFNGIGMSVFGLLFNLFLKEKGFSETVIGHILSAGSLGATIVAIPVAFLLQKYHIKYLLVVSTILAGIAYALQIYVPQVEYIILFTFIANMCITVYRVAVAPFFMRNSTPVERIYLFSVHSAIMMMSSLIGYVGGGYLPSVLRLLHFTRAQSFEISLYLSVAASLLSLYPFFLITQKAIQPPVQGWWEKLTSYRWSIILKLIIPKMLVGLGAGLVIPFMNLYFKDVFHQEAGSIGLIFSLGQIVLFFAMMAAPILTKRFGMLLSIVLTELFSIPFMLILALTQHLGLAITAFILRGALMNMNGPIAGNFEMELVRKEEQPLTNAISSLAWNGAWTVSAHWGGAIIEDHSFQYSFYMTILLYLGSALSYYLLFRKTPEALRT